MNESITYQTLQAAIDCGVREFIICAGSRNSSFVEVLRLEKGLKTYYWPEERSAAYFAMGRSRLTNRPAAIITTSGTAAGELLPAAMEAFYAGVPLLLITADRPESFRGSGAPQSAEQVKLYGCYTHFFQNITKDFPCNLSEWDQRGPAHLNVCLAEPQSQPKFIGKELTFTQALCPEFKFDRGHAITVLNRFFKNVDQPMVIVSTLKSTSHDAVVEFLIKLDVPVMLEAISGLRENPRLQHLRIRRTDKVLESARQAGYAIDGILRIGGIPTHRIWRDLEYLENEIQVCGISEMPFSGLSWDRRVICAPIEQILSTYASPKAFANERSSVWIMSEQNYEQQLLELFQEEPTAEPSYLHALSMLISDNSHVYLGNSLPIREWDLAASSKLQGVTINANRGCNGIEGQLSTFFGLCQPNRENWAIIGDLTALYDMVGPWILPQLDKMNINIVVINNGGGQIFSRLYPYKEMLNAHTIDFEPLAKLWGLSYERVDEASFSLSDSRCRLIEIIPNEGATARFLSKVGKLQQQQLAPALT